MGRTLGAGTLSRRSSTQVMLFVSRSCVARTHMIFQLEKVGWITLSCFLGFSGWLQKDHWQGLSLDRSGQSLFRQEGGVGSSDEVCIADLFSCQTVFNIQLVVGTVR